MEKKLTDYPTGAYWVEGVNGVKCICHFGDSGKWYGPYNHGPIDGYLIKRVIEGPLQPPEETN